MAPLVDGKVEVLLDLVNDTERVLHANHHTMRVHLMQV